jgi:hypothetical protein
MNVEPVKTMFKDALSDLQLVLRPAVVGSSSKSYRREFELLDRNALSLTLADGEATPDGQKPGTYYFDLATHGGEIVLRDGFLGAWDEMFRVLRVEDRETKNTAFQLFILHELIHVPQNLDSPTHEGVRQHQAILRTVDYHADAFAILLCFDLLRHRTPTVTPWTDLLAKIIEANLLAIAVFEFYSVLNRVDRSPAQPSDVAPTRYPFDRILASRLLRHLTWHYQYHRALSMPLGSFFDDFDIKREPILSIQWLMDDSRAGQGITPDWPATRRDAEFWVADRDPHGLPIVYRHRATKQEEKWRDLFRGLFEVNLNLSYKFFNEFMSRTREVVNLQQPQFKEPDEEPLPGISRHSIVQNAKYVVNAFESREIAIGDGARVEKVRPTDDA